MGARAIRALALCSALRGSCVSTEPLASSCRDGHSEGQQSSALLAVDHRIAKRHQGRSELQDPPSAPIELVVAYYCEGADWFRDWEIPTAVYLKGGDRCRSEVEAVPARPAHPGRKTLVELPNKGREGQSYLYHIVQNYDTLATYTVFAQGKGEHAGMYVRKGVDEFLAARVPAAFYPIVNYSMGRPLMVRDNEKGEQSGFREDMDTLVIDTYGEFRVADLARSAYAGLFGGSECDAPPAVFGSGAQMIVHRDAIRSKPLAFWQYLERLTRECFIYVWHLERIWPSVFDPKTRPVQEPKDPHQCRPGEVDRPAACSSIRRQTGPWQMPLLEGSL